MIRFDIKECPLCGKVLTLRKVSGVSVFQCPTASLHHPTHYEVETDTKSCIQHIYLEHWSIDNFMGSHKSRIYYRQNNKWNLYAEVSQIKADTEDNLIDRLYELMQ